MKKFIHEFKEFAMRGSVLQLAIGVVIGNAFNSIVTSLVNDIVMPVFSAILGQTSLSTLSIVLRKSVYGNTVLYYGEFLQAIINFVIITFAIFITVRIYNKLMPDNQISDVDPSVKAAQRSTEELEVLKQILDELQKK